MHLAHLHVNLYPESRLLLCAISMIMLGAKLQMGESNAVWSTLGSAETYNFRKFNTHGTHSLISSLDLNKLPSLWASNIPNVLHIKLILSLVWAVIGNLTSCASLAQISSMTAYLQTIWISDDEQSFGKHSLLYKLSC